MANSPLTELRISNRLFSIAASAILISAALICGQAMAAPAETSSPTIISAGSEATQMEPPEPAADLDLTVLMVRPIQDSTERVDIETDQLEATLSDQGLGGLISLLEQKGPVTTLARIQTTCVLTDTNSFQIAREIPFTSLRVDPSGAPIAETQAIATGLFIEFSAPEIWDDALDLEYRLEHSTSPGPSLRDVRAGGETQQIETVERSTTAMEGVIRLEAPDTVHIQRLRSISETGPSEMIIIWDFADLW